MNGDPRAALRDARRVVLKLGSRALVGEAGAARFADVAALVAAERARSRQIVIVSSGAIALGVERLGLGARPTELGALQAAAATGQSRLMRAWEDAIGAHGLSAAQVLLTHADLADRDRWLNARGAIDALLALGAVPVINENDTVAVEEIRFGDNDQLSSMVATLVGADVLVLLTDVDGLLDPAGVRVSVVRAVDEITAFVRATKSDVGTGGMASKVEAARRATLRGVPVVIAGAKDPGVVARILAGEDVGTLFLPEGAPIGSRKHWIAYTLKPRGALLLDAGAADAVVAKKRSLLPAGVVGVRGDFDAGDAVSLLAPDGREVARGLTRYGTRDAARLAGARTDEIEARIGRHDGDEIVHRDDLVVL